MTILFQTCSLKQPNRHFWSEIFFFYFFGTIFCISASFRVMIPDITIIFSNAQSKSTQKDIFDLEFKEFYFCTKLFKLSTQNYTNKAFLVPKLKLFTLHDLPFIKSEDTYSNYKYFLKILVQKYQKRVFLFQI